MQKAFENDLIILLSLAPDQFTCSVHRDVAVTAGLPLCRSCPTLQTVIIET